MQHKLKSIWTAIKNPSELYANLSNYLLLKKSAYFNSAYYLENNPDVKKLGKNPIWHYLHFGGAEGRNPSEKFDSSFYLNKYPDVNKNKQNPLVHYLRHGKKEQRKCVKSNKNWRLSFSEDFRETQEVLKENLDDLTLSFLIIAETSLPQCYKYRVQQKAEMFEYLGFPCKVVDWRETKTAHNHLQTTKVAIFYRVPAFDNVLYLLKEAQGLGVNLYFEVDDLIFNESLYKANLELLNLKKEDLNLLLKGAGFYNKTLQQCNSAIGSTPDLAAHLKAEIDGKAHVVENALDKETLQIASEIKAEKAHEKIVIAYGSGTTTHDADFEVAAPAIKKVLQEYQDVYLHLFGDLRVPDELKSLKNQIKHLPHLSFRDYLHELSKSDICITPLVDNAFNNAKSNIKFLEASVLKIPSVCSPCAAFKKVITTGENGFLAGNDDEWYQSLKLLIEDQHLKIEMGRKAYDFVMHNYHYQNIAKNQLLPFCKLHTNPPSTTKRILVVNVFFSPNSFGGATLVAEEMVNHMPEFGYSAGVFTSSFFDEIDDNDFVRTNYKKSTVFRVGVDLSSINARDYLHDHIQPYFSQTLDAFKPDLVHFHSIQGLGADMAEICKSRKIPYAITLHDYWWLCEKQFMIKQDGKFCGQESIESYVCADCVDDVEFNQKRSAYLRKTLDSADLILVPGKYMYGFYLKNGMDKNRLFINKNGIHITHNHPPNKTVGNRIHFGFVAGNETIKGYKLIKHVFESLDSSNWKLNIVDHKSQNSELGKSEIEIKGKGTIEIWPKYTKETMENYFNSIDVLLVPTQVPESFGLTAREALIRNKWVVATNAGGITEDIEDGVNGTLIPLSSNPEYLKAAVENIIRNREKLNGWVNPTGNRIRSFREQAKELAELLYHLFKVN